MPAGPWLMLGICSLSMLVLHEILLVPVLMYASETMLWKEKESEGCTLGDCWVSGGWIESQMHG